MKYLIEYSIDICSQEKDVFYEQINRYYYVSFKTKKELLTCLKKFNDGIKEIKFSVGSESIFYFDWVHEVFDEQVCFDDVHRLTVSKIV